MAQVDMSGWGRIEYPEDPQRCQAMASQGQCNLVRCEGSEYCPIHGGAKKMKALAKQSFRNYQSELYRKRLDRFAEGNGLKSLRDEIGILRMMVEALLNRCMDDHELIMKSTPLADLVMKIEKLVTSTHKLDMSLGVVMDTTKATQMIQEVLDIIAKHVEGDTLDAIIEGIQAIITRGPSGVLGEES